MCPCRSFVAGSVRCALPKRGMYISRSFRFRFLRGSGLAARSPYLTLTSCYYQRKRIACPRQIFWPSSSIDQLSPAVDASKRAEARGDAARSNPKDNTHHLIHLVNRSYQPVVTWTGPKVVSIRLPHCSASTVAFLFRLRPVAFVRLSKVWILEPSF